MKKILFLIFINFFLIHSINKELIFIEPKKNQALSLDFLNSLKSCFNVEVFIETGTYLGLTSINASKVFDEVHTIELNKELFDKAKKLFNKDIKVKIYNGDSKKILNQILPQIKKKILFFLDAHWSLGYTSRGDENTPIIEELKCIKINNIKDSIILIDDIRFFQAQNLVKEEENNESFLNYPTLKELYKYILEINHDYNLAIYGDIAIAYLKNEKVLFSQIINAMTISRFNDINSNSSDVLKAERIIKNSQNPEKKAFLSLIPLINDTEKLTLHYQLWNSLILLNENNEKALDNFNKLVRLGFNKQKLLNYKYLYESIN